MESESITDRISAKQLYLKIYTQEGNKTLLECNKALLTGIKFSARSDLQPYCFTIPIDWAVDPFKDKNWCAQLHMWRMLDPYLYQHDQTGDSDWLNLPVAIIIDWHHFFYIENRKSKIAWRDMIAGLRAMKLAYVMSQIQHGLLQVDNDTNNIFEKLAQLHLAFLLDHANISYNNHTFGDIHGAAALAQVVGQKQRTEVYDFIGEALPKLVASQFDEYGVHMENSPTYQAFCIGCLHRLVSTGWFDGFGLKSIIDKAEVVNKWFLLPDGRTIPFGDTDGKAQDVSVKTPVFSGSRQVFNSSGYVIIRDDGGGAVDKSSLLAVMGAFNSRVHKHADDLSCIWFEGEDILLDAGKYAYKTCTERNYAISERAHNTIEINKQNYSEREWYYWYKSLGPELIYGSAIREISEYDWGYLINTNVNHVRFDVNHSRFILYGMGCWLLVIDRLIGADAHDFTQWFHFAPHLPDLEKRDGGYNTVLKSGKSLRILFSGSEEISDYVEKGCMEPRLQGWISQSYGTLTSNCALGIKQKGNNVVFATLFVLNDTGATMKLEDKRRLVINIPSSDKRNYFMICIGDNSCNIEEEL